MGRPVFIGRPMIAFGGMGLVVLISATVFQGRAVFLFLENLVEMGYKVPEVLIKGLAITEKMIEAAEHIDSNDNDNK